MSATLHWNQSGNLAQSGTGLVDFMTDFLAMITAEAANADFKWEVAASDLVSNEKWVNLKRKDASAGRILVVGWSSSPSGNNSAIMTSTPTSNAVYTLWFPSGNVDTPSNLNSSSGTIMGVDTDCTKLNYSAGIGSIYGSGKRIFYFDSEEALFWFTQDPTATAQYMQGAGYIAVDGADNAIGGAMSTGTTNNSNWAGNGIFQWVPLTYWDGTTYPASYANWYLKFAGSYKPYFWPYTIAGTTAGWAFQPPGNSEDPLYNAGTNEVSFVPIPLMSRVKNEGIALKLRQIGWGPRSVGAFDQYSETGPVVVAQNANNYAAASNGCPWFVDFKM